MTHVDWHPYPNAKPKLWECKLVTHKVIAWAEMPEPYKPPEPFDMHPDAITARKYAEGDPETVKALHIFDE